ncbi:MAG: hypothetical protein KF760_03665 [Candidatus Eremiobacteraeota bacterium]|nr:hypothetical protein [Candidatus Eremiobacteraeota bacterium]MCW5872919.1 hypothetical protein [Candidatus Eremiobacteraeota bacterium]
MGLTLRQQMIRAVEIAGGEVLLERFVTKPGVFLCEEPGRPSARLRDLARHWRMDPEASSFQMLAESSAILTYMNPDSRTTTGAEYVQGILERGHSSIAGQTFVSLGLFGIPLEIVIELLSHGLDSTARLTSSNVKAMDDPLFCVFGPHREQQIERLEKILALYWPLPHREVSNSLWPSNRAVFLMMGMRLIDWQKLLDKRLPKAGNEAALRFVCQHIARVLRGVEDYRRVIPEPEDVDPWE